MVFFSSAKRRLFVRLAASYAVLNVGVHATTGYLWYDAWRTYHSSDTDSEDEDDGHQFHENCDALHHSHEAFSDDDPLLKPKMFSAAFRNYASEMYRWPTVLTLGARALQWWFGFAFATVGTSIATLGWTGDEGVVQEDPSTPREEPLHGWRRRVMQNSLQTAARLVYRAYGFKESDVTMDGEIDPRAGVIVSNHVSFLDPVVLVGKLPEPPVFLAKASIKDYPVISTWGRAIQAVYVDRRSSKSKRAAINEVKRRIEMRQKDEHAENFGPLLVFPEGTTTCGDALVNFKKGAFLFQQPVQPVILHYERCTRSGWRPSLVHSDSRGNMISPAFVIFRTLATPQHRLRIQVLPLHKPTPAETDDASLFAENVRKEMAKAGNLDLADVSAY